MRLHSLAIITLILIRVDGFIVSPQGINFNTPRSLTIRAISIKKNGDREMDDNRDTDKTGIEEELERLQQILATIETLEKQNKAQLESSSFMDEEDQWNSLEDFEKELLESKDGIVERMEKMTEELLQLWIGAKSMEG